MLNKNSDYCIQTADLLFQKRPLYQLCHNKCPGVFWFVSQIVRKFLAFLDWPNPANYLLTKTTDCRNRKDVLSVTKLGYLLKS